MLLHQATHFSSNVLDVWNWMHLDCCYYGRTTHDNGQEGGVKGNLRNSLQGQLDQKQHSGIWFATTMKYVADQNKVRRLAPF